MQCRSVCRSRQCCTVKPRALEVADDSKKLEVNLLFCQEFLASLLLFGLSASGKSAEVPFQRLVSAPILR